MDITPLLSQSLSSKSASPLKAHPFELSTLNSFLQEAYRINGHITELTRYLRTIRAPYLALGTHRSNNASSSPSSHFHSSRSHSHAAARSVVTAAAQQPPSSATNKDGRMTDADRKQVEEQTKNLITGLSRAVRELADAARASSDMASLIARRSRAKKRGGGLGGALGRWAGGSGTTAAAALDRRTTEEMEDEDRRETERLHRDGVLWFLQKRLEAVSDRQRSMVAVRLQRAREKNKSLLYNAGMEGAAGLAKPMQAGGRLGGVNGSPVTAASASAAAAAKAVQIEHEAKGPSLDDVLSPEQVQTFEKEQDDMVKFYNSELQKIR
jgi:syntaxin 18